MGAAAPHLRDEQSESALNGDQETSGREPRWPGPGAGSLDEGVSCEKQQGA